MRAPISLAISVVSITGSMRRWMAKISLSCLRSASTADCMSGYCSLQASSAPSCAARAMHLPERGGRRRMMLEARELLLPVGAELGRHAPLDEGPAHRRRLALQLHQLGGVFGRQRIRDGGHELRHLHDRAFEPAERGRQFHRVLAAVEIEAEQPRAGDARRDAAHIGADARIARRAGGESVGFAVGGAHGVKIGLFTPWANCPESSARGFPR